jgi:dolichol-phosphate mannosyltransferase
MTPVRSLQQRLFDGIEWLKSFRYIKFGLVGASGTVVNLVVLRLGHEYLFQSIEGAQGKPYASLALAIAIATLNNFTWNRLWTWADRVRAFEAANPGAKSISSPGALISQFGKYTVASWFGIALQYGLTLWLSHWLHYMLANVIAIVIASVSNFLANDRWTFGRR